jgi:hypothetical protein
MNYSLYLVAFFLVLSIIYIIIKFREKNIPIVKFENFGPGESNYQLNKKQKAKIIEQKIIHKNIAFFTWWASLIISFVLGSYCLFMLNQHKDYKYLNDALLITAGVVSTVGFRKLYNKCEKDLNNLH